MNTDKLKPFDLQKALAGEPVCTRDNRSVHDIRHFPSAKTYKVGGVIDGGDLPTGFTEKGECLTSQSHPADLFMKPKTVTMWVNVYKDGGGYAIGTPFETEDNAKLYHRISCPSIATVPVTWEE